MSDEQAVEIARLAALRDAGSITEQEYDQLVAAVIVERPAGTLPPIRRATGAETQTARQQLAQAGLEVQSHNAWLVAGRIVGLAVGLAIWWFVAGPMFGETQPVLVIIAGFVLAGLGILGGQWVTLLLLRR